jgi:hypothetical protein
VDDPHASANGEHDHADELAGHVDGHEQLQDEPLRLEDLTPEHFSELVCFASKEHPP